MLRRWGVDLSVISRLTNLLNFCSRVVRVGTSANTQLWCPMLASPAIICPATMSLEQSTCRPQFLSFGQATLNSLKLAWARNRVCKCVADSIFLLHRAKILSMHFFVQSLECNESYLVWQVFFRVVCLRSYQIKQQHIQVGVTCHPKLISNNCHVSQPSHVLIPGPCIDEKLPVAVYCVQSYRRSLRSSNLEPVRLTIKHFLSENDVFLLQLSKLLHQFQILMIHGNWWCTHARFLKLYDVISKSCLQHDVK